MKTLQEMKTYNESMHIGYIYKVTLNEDSWILSRTGKHKFEPKIFSRGINVTNWISEHLNDTVQIELICYYSSLEECRKIKNAIIKKLGKNCLNNSLRKEKTFNFVMTDKIKKSYEEKGRRASIKNEEIRQNILKEMTKKNLFKLGKNGKVFTNVNELIDWTKKQNFKFLNLLKWDSKYVYTKFQSIFNKHFISKHEFVSMLRSKYCTQNKIDFWLERGYSLDEATEKVFNFQQKGNLASKQACELFAKYYFLLKDKYHCYIHQKVDINSHEYFIKNEKNFYQYDFCILEKKLIFEFNGSHVHANPNWSKERLHSWRHCFSKETAEENIKEYNKKIKTAENQGFKVIVIWDEDENKEQIIEQYIS